MFGQFLELFVKCNKIFKQFKRFPHSFLYGMKDSHRNHDVYNKIDHRLFFRKQVSFNIDNDWVLKLGNGVTR